LLLNIATEKMPKPFPQKNIKKVMLTNEIFINGNHTFMLSTTFFEILRNSISLE